MKSRSQVFPETSRPQVANSSTSFSVPADAATGGPAESGTANLTRKFTWATERIHQLTRDLTAARYRIKVTHASLVIDEDEPYMHVSETADQIMTTCIYTTHRYYSL